MKARALGRPCHPKGLAVASPEREPRPVTAGTYRSPERAPKDHGAREARRAERKGWAEHRRAAVRRGLRTVKAYVGKGKGAPTPKRDAVRRERAVRW